MRAFIAVAKTGNFSRAAQRIFRTQPSVTVAVRRLERELGARLFERHGKKTKLTPAGESLFEETAPLLAGWDRLKDVVVPATRGKLSGHVRIGAGEAVMLYLLPKILKSFRRENPEVKFSLFCQRREQTLEMLKAGELDFGVRSMEQAPAWAAYKPNLAFERVVVAEKGHAIRKKEKLTLSEIARFPILTGDIFSSTRRIVEGKLTEAGLGWQVGLEAGGWEVLKRYAREGLGVAVVPNICLTEEDSKTLVVVRAGHLFGHDHYGIITRRGGEITEAARRIMTRIDPDI